jgi:hypothetical protein
MTTEYYQYAHRLGYQFIKEYDRSLLFRYGCPANGPCNFALVDKTTGKTFKQFGELIYNPSSNNPFFEFVLYFTDSTLTSLTLHYIDTDKKYIIPVNSRQFNAVAPESEFDDIAVKGNLLTLTYTYAHDNKVEKKKINVKLQK